MPKQTVEEAANLTLKKIRTGGHVVKESWGIGYRKGFQDGSAWQKEQGIDWIRVDEKLPEPVHQYDHGSESARVLLTNGEKIEYSFHIWFKNGDIYGWHFCSFIPTHWALINLPKTD